jgi:hypothetical protein
MSGQCPLLAVIIPAIISAPSAQSNEFSQRSHRIASRAANLLTALGVQSADADSSGFAIRDARLNPRVDFVGRPSVNPTGELYRPRKVASLKQVIDAAAAQCCAVKHRGQAKENSHLTVPLRLLDGFGIYPHLDAAQQQIAAGFQKCAVYLKSIASPH